MSTIDAKALIQRGGALFGKRGNLMSFWQDIADNFYPERAIFTAGKTPGEEFAGTLMSSYPLLVRRELGSAIAAMLRPRDQQWGSITVERDDLLDSAGKEWLEFATRVQWRAMYHRRAGFVRATTEGDHDFATFGQCVITRDINWNDSALLYRTWHLKDCAWAEDYAGHVNELHVNWNPTCDQLCKSFPSKVHQNIKTLHAQNPHQEVPCRIIYVPGDVYSPPTQRRKMPFTTVYLDLQNETILQEAGRWNEGFTLPRWQTVSQSQYAYSPAVIAALPDARLIQAMTLTLLEAGEMATRPPVLAKQDLIRSDVNFYAGGVTWINAEEGTKLDDVLRPVYQEKSGMPMGMDMAADIRQQIAAAFYLNKLGLPPTDRAMTAYETAQRLQEWIRGALPLFEPMETNYNGSLCEGTFDDLLRVGAFGPLDEIPESVRGREVQFRFESPLHENIERKKAHVFLEAKELIGQAAELDPSTVPMMDARKMLRDALTAIGVPADRMRTEDEMDEIQSDAADAAEAQEAMMAAAGAGAAAEQVGKGKKAMEAA